MIGTQTIVGVDFDNTIVSYDRLFHKLAMERGFVSPEGCPDKKTVRDTVRSLPDGETQWQELQALAYGPRIGEAVLIEGVMEFFRLAARHGVRTYVVSHKTRFASRDVGRIDLLQAAHGFMRQNRFFDPQGLGLSDDRVFFETSRLKKIERIVALGCTHFIDDLQEFFLEESFPTSVERLLFQPDAAPAYESRIRVFSSWQDIVKYFFPEVDPSPTAEKFSSLLRLEIASVERLGGGRNSRVFRLRAGNGQTFVGKEYFADASDPRDRLGAEFNGLSFLWDHGIRRIPRPVAMSRELNIAAFDFVHGKRIDCQRLESSDLMQLVEFASELEVLGRSRDSVLLPRAAAACFSGSEILDREIGDRILRLETADSEEPEALSLSEFLNGELKPTLSQIAEWSRGFFLKNGMRFDTALEKDELTLSPSDFGFHNALKTAEGKIFFLDFEYFGWDDPAKMISDILYHPGMELSTEAKTEFVRRILSVFSNRPMLRERVEGVYPLFGLNWCLILLNEFLPRALERRRFACGDGQKSRRHVQSDQLSRAKALLATVRRSYPSFPYGR